MRDSGQDQFVAIVAPHLEALFRVAWRLLRNTADAQDLVQDTCVIACSKLPEIAAASSPLHWLLCVLQNRFIDGHRRRRRSPIVSVEESEDVVALASDGFDPEELLQQFQDEQLLQQAFLQLNDTHRTLLSLRAEGYELPEIEAITGIDRKVLSSRLKRARITLAQRLIEQKSMAANTRRLGSQS
jgi:RNA polymerase sigma factor (sigma-70 family)